MGVALLAILNASRVLQVKMYREAKHLKIRQHWAKNCEKAFLTDSKEGQVAISKGVLYFINAFS